MWSGTIFKIPESFFINVTRIVPITDKNVCLFVVTFKHIRSQNSDHLFFFCLRINKKEIIFWKLPLLILVYCFSHGEDRISSVQCLINLVKLDLDQLSSYIIKLTRKYFELFQNFSWICDNNSAFIYFRHIYFPLLQKFQYKLLTSFICFCFVCIWHGSEDYILIWTVMNYIGIVIEDISASFYKKYSNLHSIIGPTTIKNIVSILAAPLLAFSAISNFYFFGGKDIGDIFLKRLFGKNSVIFYLLITVNIIFRKSVW